MIPLIEQTNTDIFMEDQQNYSQISIYRTRLIWHLVYM